MARAIMIQGTMSNAGKSLLAAGLCRIFRQDGYRVAPFKAQNMALNSCVTAEGLEMGRAQAVQAEAAGIPPSVDMNPILLKPANDTGSQVIVCGKPEGMMAARDYFAYKKRLIPRIREAYGRLAAAFDIIVIEGAGSPAEINLKQDDIVNMGMAAMADAPVLLAGDIDRGGVFAQLYGTVMLLEEEERRRIKGLIVNKFRGDPSILEPGVRMLEQLCRIPVAGVVPYMQVDLEDEDSLSGFLSGESRRAGGPAAVRIAVIRFPRISNFTDFAVFSCVPGVEVDFVSSAGELGQPDLLILPGTKNTIGDLLWMRQNGLEAAALKLEARGVPIWGICGGYQMLGEILLDPLGAESGTPAQVAGMGLLPLKTVYEEEKTRTLVSGAFGELEGVFSGLSGMAAEGYEIHMGKTEVNREGGLADTARMAGGNLEICRPTAYLMERQSGSKRVKADGYSRGNVYGAYVHGIFDAEGIAGAVAAALMERKGLDPAALGAPADYRAYRESQYDRLADGLRESLDMGLIYRAMGLDGPKSGHRAEGRAEEGEERKG